MNRYPNSARQLDECYRLIGRSCSCIQHFERAICFMGFQERLYMEKQDSVSAQVAVNGGNIPQTVPDLLIRSFIKVQQFISEISGREKK